MYCHKLYHYLHFSLGLHPETRYAMRSSLVSGSAATTASSVGGLAVTITLCPRFHPSFAQSRCKVFVFLAEVHNKEDEPTKFSFTLDTSKLPAILRMTFFPDLLRIISLWMQYDEPVCDMSAMVGP